MTKKEKEKLYQYIDQLHDKNQVMIQEYNPNKAMVLPVYNSNADQPEILQ